MFIEYVDKPTFGSYKLQDRFDEIVYNIDFENKDDVDFTYCGVCTDICVVSNALLTRANYRNNNIYVVRDATAGVTPELENAAVDVMKSCQIEFI